MPLQVSGRTLGWKKDRKKTLRLGCHWNTLSLSPNLCRYWFWKGSHTSVYRTGSEIRGAATVVEVPVSDHRWDLYGGGWILWQTGGSGQVCDAFLPEDNHALVTSRWGFIHPPPNKMPSPLEFFLSTGREYCHSMFHLESLEELGGYIQSEDCGGLWLCPWCYWASVERQNVHIILVSCLWWVGDVSLTVVVRAWLAAEFYVIFSWKSVEQPTGYGFIPVLSLGRGVRKSGDPFGGIQLIICGDFLQLPPVSKTTDQPKFCFQVCCCFSLHILLLADLKPEYSVLFCRPRAGKSASIWIWSWLKYGDRQMRTSFPFWMQSVWAGEMSHPSPRREGVCHAGLCFSILPSLTCECW